MSLDTPAVTRICVDASFLGYQALHTLGELGTDEVPTGVLYNVLSRVLAIGQLYSTNHFIFAFDAPTVTGVRRKACPTYKLKRQEDRDKDPDGEERRAALRQQLEALFAPILPSLGFTNVFKVAGFEADDIIAAVVGEDLGPQSLYRGGCLMAAGSNVNDRFIIVSSDQDLYQLLGKGGRVSMYNPTTRKEYGYADFHNEYRIIPQSWPVAKCWAGCSTDNVDGIDGIGEITACKHIRGELGPGKKLDVLLDKKDEMLKRNWPLVKLPHPAFPWKELTVRPPEFAGKAVAFKELCGRYAFATFLREPLFSQWRAFFKGEFVPQREPQAKTPLGRVELRKPHVSPPVSHKTAPRGHAAPAGGGDFGF